MDQYAEEKRTEKNLIVRKQLIIKDCARRFILKVYRHEALRGLFATAELLVASRTGVVPAQKHTVKADSRATYDAVFFILQSGADGARLASSGKSI